MKITAWLLDTERPCRPPVKAEVQIHRTAKMRYAVHESGQRFVIGTTAFFTEKAAWQRWQGELDRIRKSRYMERAFPARWEQASRLCRVHVYRTYR